MEVPFVVEGHSWKSKAGKTPVYKVSLKNPDGHSLTLVSDSRKICEDFPKDAVFTVKIGRAQLTLDEVPGEEE